MSEENAIPVIEDQPEAAAIEIPHEAGRDQQGRRTDFQVGRPNLANARCGTGDVNPRERVLAISCSALQQRDIIAIVKNEEVVRIFFRAVDQEPRLLSTSSLDVLWYFVALFLKHFQEPLIGFSGDYDFLGLVQFGAAWGVIPSVSFLQVNGTEFTGYPNASALKH